MPAQSGKHGTIARLAEHESMLSLVYSGETRSYHFGQTGLDARAKPLENRHQSIADGNLFTSTYRRQRTVNDGMRHRSLR